ncbi:MAG: addiction module protein [Candidatus Binatia bacterium]
MSRALDALICAERLQLLDQLWESLRQSPDNVPLTQAQREELDRRLDDLNVRETTDLHVKRCSSGCAAAPGENTHSPSKPQPILKTPTNATRTSKLVWAKRP